MSKKPRPHEKVNEEYNLTIAHIGHRRVMIKLLEQDIERLETEIQGYEKRGTALKREAFKMVEQTKEITPETDTTETTETEVTQLTTDPISTDPTETSETTDSTQATA